ncbi:MAG: hypothetical protein AB7O24_18390 [Kofleriaceae bacterium]
MNVLGKLVTCAVLATSACVIEDSGADLEIFNDSSYFFDEINIAPIDTVTWGRNLVGIDGLAPGESLVVEGIECDYYDVRVVDEHGHECIFFDADLCLNSSEWSITNADLDQCAL